MEEERRVRSSAQNELIQLRNESAKQEQRMKEKRNYCEVTREGLLDKIDKVTTSTKNVSRKKKRTDDDSDNEIVLQLIKKTEEKRNEFEKRRKVYLDKMTASTTNVSRKKKRTDEDSDNAVLQLLISEKEEIRKQLEGVADKARNDIVFEFENAFQKEPRCAICHEMYVKAISLNCNHIFCQWCINDWKRQKKECPTCCTYIITDSRAHVLDNVIDGLVALSQQAREKRNELVLKRML